MYHHACSMCRVSRINPFDAWWYKCKVIMRSARPHDNLTVRKKWRNHKNPLVYKYKHLFAPTRFSSYQEVRNSVTKMSRPRLLDKRKKCYKKSEGRYRTWIIFHVSVVFLTVVVRWFRFHSFTSDVIPHFMELTPKYIPQLPVVFKSSYLVSKWLTIPRRVQSPINHFFCFLFCAHFPNGIFIWAPSANQNLLLIPCWFVCIFLPGRP